MIEDVFGRALDVAEEERAAFVARECGDDRELLDEVNGLLGKVDGASDVLHGAVAAAAGRFAGEVSAAWVGRRIGPYRLVELLGEGGMGAVYSAERDDAEYKRGVAIKILQHGLGSPQAIARFRDERQILAALDHPGIVRLLDGGRTEDGLPYLVMERVDGVSIAKYVARLPVRERIEPVLQVCAALQFAHGKLVVHRDIKPSNILVTSDGTARLLDFGIAKLTAPGAAEQLEAKTRTGMALLTPEYASPEQARGEAVSVATDVYSLGAVLYELLSGRPPQQPRGGALEMLETICKIDPPKPSTVAAPEWQRDIAGDLDNITMKALRKEPRERYASIEALAEDLRRYLDGMPVTARTSTFSYRTGKFVRRNAGKLALGALVTIALSTATVVSIRQAHRADAEAQRAQKRFDEVRKLSNSLLFEIDDSVRDVAGTTRTRELVVSRALTYLDGLAREARGDAALSRELAIAYMKVGDIQGSPHEPNIGKTAEGLASYEKANALLATQDPHDPEVASAQLRAMFGTGFMYQSNRKVDQARDTLAKAIARTPGVKIDPIVVARAHLALAFLEKEAGNLVESERHTDDGLAYVATWDPDAADTKYWRAIFLGRRGEAAGRAGDAERAVAALAETSTIYDDLVKAYPTVGKYTREQAVAKFRLSIAMSGVGDSRLWVANTGDLANAEKNIREALAIIEKQSADDPNNADYKMVVAAVRTSLGLIIAKREPRDAAKAFEDALAAYEVLPHDMRISQYGKENEFIAHCAYANVLAALGRAGDAHAQEAIGIPMSRGEALNEAMCEALVGRMAATLGDTQAAIGYFHAAQSKLDNLTSRPDTSAMIGYVDVLEQLARISPDACALRKDALARWQAHPRETKYWRERQRQLEDASCK